MLEWYNRIKYDNEITGVKTLSYILLIIFSMEWIQNTSHGWISVHGLRIREP